MQYQIFISKIIAYCSYLVLREMNYEKKFYLIFFYILTEKVNVQQKVFFNDLIVSLWSVAMFFSSSIHNTFSIFSLIRLISSSNSYLCCVHACTNNIIFITFKYSTTLLCLLRSWIGREQQSTGAWINLDTRRQSRNVRNLKSSQTWSMVKGYIYLTQTNFRQKEFHSL